MYSMKSFSEMAGWIFYAIMTTHMEFFSSKMTRIGFALEHFLWLRHKSTLHLKSKIKSLVDFWSMYKNLALKQEIVFHTNYIFFLQKWSILYHIGFSPLLKIFIQKKKFVEMKYGWPIFEISLSDFTSLDLRNPP